MDGLIVNQAFKVLVTFPREQKRLYICLSGFRKHRYESSHKENFRVMVDCFYFYTQLQVYLLFKEVLLRKSAERIYISAAWLKSAWFELVHIIALLLSLSAYIYNTIHWNVALSHDAIPKRDPTHTVKWLKFQHVVF